MQVKDQQEAEKKKVASMDIQATIAVRVHLASTASGLEYPSPPPASTQEATDIFDCINIFSNNRRYNKWRDANIRNAKLPSFSKQTDGVVVTGTLADGR